MYTWHGQQKEACTAAVVLRTAIPSFPTCHQYDCGRPTRHDIFVIFTRPSYDRQTSDARAQTGTDKGGKIGKKAALVVGVLAPARVVLVTEAAGLVGYKRIWGPGGRGEDCGGRGTVRVEVPMHVHLPAHHVWRRGRTCCKNVLASASTVKGDGKA